SEGGGPTSLVPTKIFRPSALLRNETRRARKHVEANATSSAICTGRSESTEGFGEIGDTPEALVHEVGRRGWKRAARNSSWGPTTSVPLPIFLSPILCTALLRRETRFHWLEVGRRP